MDTKKLLGIFLILCTVSAVSLLPFSTADTLASTDFNLQSWSKTVDYFNYLRLDAALTGKPLPPASWHAWTYLAYINTTGLQLFYCGLQNITLGSLNFTTPLQTVLMHYKTQNTSSDVVTASSFLMLMAFRNNETATNIPNSPDVNDTLYASTSFGVDLSKWFGNTPPAGLNSQTTVIPLTESADGTHWSWGMQYTNLTAIWYRTYIDPNNHSYNSTPVAVTRYNELTFTYNLTINTATRTATLTQNYVIRRMRDLYFWASVNGLPALLHFNSTGCYRTFAGTELNGTTIYDWLSENQIKMSIIQYQTTMMINHTVQNLAGSQNVTDSDVNVTNSDVATIADTGEKVLDASFGAKNTYQLYNYTADPAEKTYTNYTAVIRTAKIRGFALNAVISNSTSFLRYVTYVLRHIDEPMYNQGTTLTLNVTGANYLYIISYPTYSGFKIVNDPMLTMYYAPTVASTTTSTTALNWLPIGVSAIIVIAMIALAVSLMMKRRMTKP